MLDYPTSVTTGRQKTHLLLHSSSILSANTGTSVQKNKQEDAEHSHLFISSDQNQSSEISVTVCT